MVYIIWNANYHTYNNEHGKPTASYRWASWDWEIPSWNNKFKTLERFTDHLWGLCRTLLVWSPKKLKDHNKQLVWVNTVIDLQSQDAHGFRDSIEDPKPVSDKWGSNMLTFLHSSHWNKYIVNSIVIVSKRSICYVHTLHHSQVVIKRLDWRARRVEVYRHELKIIVQHQHHE